MSCCSEDEEANKAQMGEEGSQVTKTIVFSYFTKALDMLASQLSRAGLDHQRLDGSMSLGHRSTAVACFRDNPEVAATQSSWRWHDTEACYHGCPLSALKAYARPGTAHRQTCSMMHCPIVSTLGCLFSPLASWSGLRRISGANQCACHKQDRRSNCHSLGPYLFPCRRGCCYAPPRRLHWA